MKTISSSLFHRILPPERGASTLHPAIVYLHGLGADEEDLLGLSGMFNPRFLSIAVRAPFKWEFSGYTWYDILEMGKPDPEMFKASYEKLRQFIAEAVANYPIDPRKLFLFGFSMGTVMSYSCLLTMPHAFAGVVANSGYLAEDTHLSYQWEAIAGRKLFISHGVEDTLIPVAAAQRARFLFDNAHAALSYKEYSMAHQINNESIADISRWLDAQIDGQSL